MVNGSIFMPLSNSDHPNSSAAPAQMPIPQPVVMPTLLGVGYGNYEVKANNFLVSVAIHIVLVGLLIWSASWVSTHQEQVRQAVVPLISPFVMPAAPDQTGGGGGGGDHSKLEASTGHPPKFKMDVITPPTAVIKNPKPKLEAEQALLVPPQIHLPTSQTQIGDPLTKALEASNGVGAGSGIGSGSNGGIGSGNGRGLGPGLTAGTGGGIFRVGGGVSAPKPIFAPDPEYSEEARKAKYQGTVVLSIIVGPDGRAHDIHVARALGLGLDEKAIEAVKTWKFDPARKDGQPVAVAVSIEVSFNLY